jgi:hypothetical protein
MRSITRGSSITDRKRTSRALVRETAEQMGEAVRAMKACRVPWLPGYLVKVLDGNCIEASEHRLGVLREVAGRGAAGQVGGAL